MRGRGKAVRVMLLLGQSGDKPEKVAVGTASASDGETCCHGVSQPAGAGVWGFGSSHTATGWTNSPSLQGWAGRGLLWGRALLRPSALFTGFTARRGSAGSWTGSASLAPSRHPPPSLSVRAVPRRWGGEVLWGRAGGEDMVEQIHGTHKSL